MKAWSDQGHEGCEKTVSYLRWSNKLLCIQDEQYGFEGCFGGLFRVFFK